MVLGCAVFACAGGSGGGTGSHGLGASDELTSSTTGGRGADSSSSGAPEGDEDPSDATTPPDLGACGGDEDCVLVDEGCFEAQGVCDGGSCRFEEKLAGVPCDDGDDCTDQDVCNGMGGCLGAPVECVFEHGSAACVDGGCGPLACDDGWGDCNGDATDGCEASLDTASDCGGCGEPCAAGPNASASCDAGSCTLACDAPYENCDDDWSNGCEIPTGVANQCDATGLNPTTGCWTAHCGSSNNPDARNFGTWFCFECTTCNVPAAGQCRWCSHDTGTWFPQETCPCGASEDLVCNP